MSKSNTYPRLQHLMESYLNQDFDLYGDDDRAVVEQLVRDSSPQDVTATITEIDRLLAEGVVGLSERFVRETGHLNVSVGETDAETRHWLMSTRDILAQS